MCKIISLQTRKRKCHIYTTMFVLFFIQRLGTIIYQQPCIRRVSNINNRMSAALYAHT